MSGRVIGAVTLILLGSVFLVNNLGLANIRLFELLRVWWPAILIIIGVSMLVKPKSGK
jgi:hypothetical protein